MKNLVPNENVSDGGKFSDLNVKVEFNREDRVKCSNGDGIISKDYSKAFYDIYGKKINVKESVREYIKNKVKECHEKVSEWLKTRVPYNFKIESFCSDFWAIRVVIDGNSECFQKDPLLKYRVNENLYDLMRECEEDILSDEFCGFTIYPEINDVEINNNCIE